VLIRNGKTVGKIKAVYFTSSQNELLTSGTSWGNRLLKQAQLASSKKGYRNYITRMKNYNIRRMTHPRDICPHEAKPAPWGGLNWRVTGEYYRWREHAHQ